jgi:hypothetical protein
MYGIAIVDLATIAAELGGEKGKLKERTILFDARLHVCGRKRTLIVAIRTEVPRSGFGKRNGFDISRSSNVCASMIATRW